MDDNQYVYFVRNPKTKKIKIGKSKDPAKRIRSLQSSAGAELEILHVVGYNDLELEMHDKFSDLRETGEWFKPEGDLIDFLLSAKSTELPASSEEPEDQEEDEGCLMQALTLLSFADYHIVQVVSTLVIFVLTFGFMLLAMMLSDTFHQDFETFIALSGVGFVSGMLSFTLGRAVTLIYMKGTLE